MANLLDYDCGCAIESDGKWRGCYTHWSQVVRKEKELKHSVYEGKIVCNGHFCDLDGTKP